LLLDLDTQNNLDLNCINVSSDQLSDIPLDWIKSDNTQYSDECDVVLRRTSIPDNNFEQALIDLGYDTTLDNYVLTKNIERVRCLKINHKSIKSLKGIEAFTKLSYLSCVGNKIQTLNLSSNRSLKKLFASNNRIKSIDLSNNQKLKVVGLDNNNFTSLDMTKLPHLVRLYCQSSKIRILKMRNGNNHKLVTFKVDK